ncbi:MAG: FKBP-type peptidyl-prolyl cis-trans isomerase [Flavobacteriales bacterium]|nr:FKBP-type peptidyl-prolyl cis-trans isomerase [Flavobacteriales bacterium]
MKSILPITLLVALALVLSQCKPAQQSTEFSGLNNAKDSLSYALGLSVGSNMTKQDLDDIETELFKKGMEDAFMDTMLIDLAEADMFIRNTLKKIQDEKAEAAKKEGEDWLAENATKEGVVTLPSGLQYKVLQEGSGDNPDGNDRVTVHYEGKLTNGEIFDSSYQKGKPYTTLLTQVVRGWTEGVPLMNKGAIYELYIPQDMGYGGRPSPGGQIPAYSTLVFKVELIDWEAVD